MDGLGLFYLLFSQAIIQRPPPMDIKHDLLILGSPSGLSTALHLATRILILKNGKWQTLMLFAARTFVLNWSKTLK